MMKRVVSHGPGGAGRGRGEGRGRDPASPAPQCPRLARAVRHASQARILRPAVFTSPVRGLICHSLAGNRRILEFIVFKEPRIDNRDILWLPVIKNLFCKRVTNRTKCSLADVGF